MQPLRTLTNSTVLSQHLDVDAPALVIVAREPGPPLAVINQQLAVESSTLIVIPHAPECPSIVLAQPLSLESTSLLIDAGQTISPFANLDQARYIIAPVMLLYIYISS